MFVLALIFFTNVALQLGHGNSELTERCYCEDPTLSTIWGKFEGAGFCEGGCVGTQVGTRECYLNPKENLVHDKKVLCDITRVCWHPEQCDGAWTTWSNVGSCQSNCLQNQSRICYRVSNNSCICAEAHLCVVVVVHIPVTGQHQTITIRRAAHFSLQ